MEINGPTKRRARSVALFAALLSAAMLVSVLVPMATPAADALSGPCPHYSIHDVFADPSGNWDGDQVNNSDELYNGLNPCIVDTGTYCGGGGNPLCTYYNYVYVSNYPTACQQHVNAYPTGDYDGDGIGNNDEVRQGANPCTRPCSSPSNADLALNPNGDWDGDGFSNAIEVSRGTNPCRNDNIVTHYNPCPTYTYALVNAQPSLDWDRDGISNANEVRQGTNPCIFNTIQRLQHVQTTNRLPHVSSTTQIIQVIAVPAIPVCPVGYPYYHRANGLCYANPIGQTYRY